MDTQSCICLLCSPLPPCIPSRQKWTAGVGLHAPAAGPEPSVLLSQNRVSEFHTELERLSARDIQTNVYIRHPVSLEQVIMGLEVSLLAEQPHRMAAWAKPFKKKSPFRLVVPNPLCATFCLMSNNIFTDRPLRVAYHVTETSVLTCIKSES